MDHLWIFDALASELPLRQCNGLLQSETESCRGGLLLLLKWVWVLLVMLCGRWAGCRQANFGAVFSVFLQLYKSYAPRPHNKAMLLLVVVRGKNSYNTTTVCIHIFPGYSQHTAFLFLSSHVLLILTCSNRETWGALKSKRRIVAIVGRSNVGRVVIVRLQKHAFIRYLYGYNFRDALLQK